jgi:CheY-like chemotaxis protein
MKGMGGFIHLYSEPGKDTEFKIYLRAQTSADAAEEAAVGQAAVEQVRLPRGDGEMVLVVDDEESIRTIVRGTLERFGYRALAANNGAEAVGLYANRRTEIDVVLTDMAMPVMDGAATIAALRTIDPVVKIIGSSGLTSEASISGVLGIGATYFIPKPYTAETLLTPIRRAVLDDGTRNASAQS